MRVLPETLEEAYVLASQHYPENVNGRRSQQHNHKAKPAKVDATAALTVTEEQPLKSAAAATGHQPPPFAAPNSALAVARYLREGDALLDTGCTDHIVRDKSILTWFGETNYCPDVLTSSISHSKCEGMGWRSTYIRLEMDL
mmetsp:Transcript_20709/g.20817  ORF Transcript_20709/g.20817 Transcript_20709/m.20817 type:complete len:142 (-) Transcript_20709:762-1187(-)